MIVYKIDHLDDSIINYLNERTLRYITKYSNDKINIAYGYKVINNKKKNIKRVIKELSK